MADPRSVRVITNQYARVTKIKHEHLRFHMCENNVRIWYVLITGLHGDENEFAGGEYLVRMELPEEYPFKPPHFYFLTPQGLYGVEKKVCVSIGEYHSDQYRAVLGIDGFCAQLVSGLVAWKEMTGGIAIIKSSAAEKAHLADNSALYNREHHAPIIDLFR